FLDWCLGTLRGRYSRRDHCLWAVPVASQSSQMTAVRTSHSNNKVVFLPTPVVSLSFVHTHSQKEPPQKGICTMSTEDNKANVRRGFEAVNQKNLTVFDELLTPDIVFHSASTTMQGLEAYKQF